MQSTDIAADVLKDALMRVEAALAPVEVLDIAYPPPSRVLAGLVPAIHAGTLRLR